MQWIVSLRSREQSLVAGIARVDRERRQRRYLRQRRRADSHPSRTRGSVRLTRIGPGRAARAPARVAIDTVRAEAPLVGLLGRRRIRPALEVRELHESLGRNLDTEEVADEPPDRRLEVVGRDGAEDAVEERRGGEEPRVPIADTGVRLGGKGWLPLEAVHRAGGEDIVAQVGDEDHDLAFEAGEGWERGHVRLDLRAGPRLDLLSACGESPKLT